MHHIIITPAKNEEAYIGHTIESVVAQTVRPIEWIIVNDNSDDGTAAIVNKYQTLHPWIRLVEKKDDPDERAGGGKVVRAFYYGYERLNTAGFDLITKLDADLSLPEDYFEKIIEAFKEIPELGICGGTCYINNRDRFIPEIHHAYHVRGALKSIRKTCFDEIGGFRPIINWDGVDELTAMYKGWKTFSLPLKVIHHRPTSKAYKPLNFSYKIGYAAYQRRVSIFLTIGRSINRMKERPFVINGIAYFYGFISAFFNGEKPLLERNLSRFINRFYFMKIFQKKRFDSSYLNIKFPVQ